KLKQLKFREKSRIDSLRGASVERNVLDKSAPIHHCRHAIGRALDNPLAYCGSIDRDVCLPITVIVCWYRKVLSSTSPGNNRVSSIGGSLDGPYAASINCYVGLSVAIVVRRHWYVSSHSAPTYNRVSIIR